MLDVSISLNRIATTSIDSYTAGRSPHSDIESVTILTEPSEQSYSGFTDRNTDSPHDRPYQLIEHVRNYNEAVYDEPHESDNDSAETGYLEPIERGNDLAETEYLTPIDTPIDGNDDNGNDNDNNSAEAAQRPVDDEQPYEDLDVAADGDSANPAYGGQVQEGNNNSANLAYRGQVASDDSVYPAHDNIGDLVK
jgi:hypothetical protein